MTRADIAIRIYEQTGISLLEASRLLECVLDFIKTTLQSGESIKIAGFGNFTARNKHARRGRNPRTGEPIPISARRVVTFQASNLFKAHINSPETEGLEGSA